MLFVSFEKDANSDVNENGLCDFGTGILKIPAS